MIDLHAHILPAVDDGARDLGETIAMLEIAAADGIGTIAGTPHFDISAPGCLTAVAGARAAARQAARERSLPIEIVDGFELALTPALADAGDAARALALHGSRYLLVELPQGLWAPFTLDVLFRLQAAGFQPILAHAERYDAIVWDGNVAKDLVRRGTLLQVNGDSLLGAGGRRIQRCARDLLSRGLVSFLASDAHSPRRRAPRLQRALNAAAREIGAPAAEALVTGNPAAVIAGEGLPAAPPLCRRWRLFSRAWSEGAGGGRHALTRQPRREPRRKVVASVAGTGMQRAHHRRGKSVRFVRCRPRHRWH